MDPWYASRPFERERLAEPLAAARVRRYLDRALARRARDESDPEPERLAVLQRLQLLRGHLGQLDGRLVAAAVAVDVDHPDPVDVRAREAADQPAGGGLLGVLQEPERLREHLLGVAAPEGRGGRQPVAPAGSPAVAADVGPPDVQAVAVGERPLSTVRVTLPSLMVGRRPRSSPGSSCPSALIGLSRPRSAAISGSYWRSSRLPFASYATYSNGPRGMCRS